MFNLPGSLLMKMPIEMSVLQNCKIHQKGSDEFSCKDFRCKRVQPFGLSYIVEICVQLKQTVLSLTNAVRKIMYNLSYRSKMAGI